MHCLLKPHLFAFISLFSYHHLPLTFINIFFSVTIETEAGRRTSHHRCVFNIDHQSDFVFKIFFKTQMYRAKCVASSLNITKFLLLQSSTTDKALTELEQFFHVSSKIVSLTRLLHIKVQGVRRIFEWF